MINLTKLNKIHSPHDIYKVRLYHKICEIASFCLTLENFLILSEKIENETSENIMSLGRS
jgi:hypothetical protein